MPTRAVLIALVLAVCGLTAAATPDLQEGCRAAGTDADGGVREVCTVVTFATCPAPVVAGPVNGPVPLSTDAPSGSLTGGSGCAAPADPVTSGEAGADDLTFATIHTGNLDSIGVELHVAGPGYATLAEVGPLVDIAYSLSVDGGVIRRGRLGDLTIDLDATRTTGRLTFELTALGLVDEVGRGETERAIALSVGHPHINACDPAFGTASCFPAGLHAHVWGAADVPAGLTFNGSR